MLASNLGTNHFFVMLFMNFKFQFQNQVIEFAWNSISQYDIDDHCGIFCFQYVRQNKPPRWVKIYSHHVSSNLFKILNAHVVENPGGGYRRSSCWGLFTIRGGRDLYHKIMVEKHVRGKWVLNECCLTWFCLVALTGTAHNSLSSSTGRH